MFSLYELKPGFQRLLEPVVRWLAAMDVSANVVTATALVGSVVLGSTLLIGAQTPALFLLLPVWTLLRMACDAIDGMLARSYGQESKLGVYFNELADVVGDAALYLPFVLVPPFGWASVGAVIFLSALSEMAGALGLTVGSCRRHEGPMGKSDRALVFGTLGLWVGVAGRLPGWAFWIMPCLCGAIALNIINRTRRAIG